MRGEFPVQNKSFWSVGGFVATIFVMFVVGSMLVGFYANPAPQPQRVSDLVARLEVLEEENRAQQDALDGLNERVDALELSGVGTGAPVFDDDVARPDEWEQNDSGDGVVRYWAGSSWELASDEPGTLDLWLDEDTAIFYTWDWAYDLLVDLHDDEDFLRFFEEDLVWSDETLQMDVEESGPVEFMGEDGYYWEISVESADGYASRMLSIFYPCNDRTSCNVTFVRFQDMLEDDEPIMPFASVDWSFVHTFASAIEFLTAGKATVTANAHLRECPATSCEIVGRLVRGEIVELVAVSEDGAWYRLESGEWLSSALVFDAPLDLPVVGGTEDV